MKQQRIILLAGPTAAGKSALALKMAREYGGSIINADAMQVYAGLPILSAQPSATDLAEAPHALYGVLDPAAPSSAGKWLDMALKSIKEAIDQGGTPILVGGTGLYFRALMGGLDNIPLIPDEVRQSTQKLYDDLGEKEFRERLRKLDAASAEKLARNDRQRLVRAFEVATHTGKPLSAWHNKPDKAADFHGMGFAPLFEKNLVIPDREKLYTQCDARFTDMIDRGAVDEVRTFLGRNLPPTLPTMKTIGVREIGAYLNGKITLDEAVVKAQQVTRNYAKRQLTWFRNQWDGQDIFVHNSNPALPPP